MICRKNMHYNCISCENHPQIYLKTVNIKPKNANAQINKH